MAELHPFNGIRYNPSKVSDLAQVICPPYDIISPQQQDELYERFLYNFVRIEYGKEFPNDDEGDNKYTRALVLLEQWLSSGVLVADEKPTIYVHDHYYWHNNRQMRRRGIVSCVRLEEWHRNIVRPHERIMGSAKLDRISLIRTIKANTSPILAMYQDKNHVIADLLERVTKEKPQVAVNTLEEERHELWAITEREDLKTVILSLAEEALYIADGHHRYESALFFQREQMATKQVYDPMDNFNYVMMTLVSFDDPGLLILPPHRVLRGLSPVDLVELKRSLPEYFDIKIVPLDNLGVWDEIDTWQTTELRPHLAVFGLDGTDFWLLALRDFQSASKKMPPSHSEIYKRMDVSVVDHIVLETLLSIQPESEKGLSFNYDCLSAVQSVLSGEFQLAFIIQAVRPEMIKEISDISDRMPRKSTYFYPKLPSGLVINRLIR